MIAVHSGSSRSKRNSKRSSVWSGGHDPTRPSCFCISETKYKASSVSKMLNQVIDLQERIRYFT